MPIYNSAKKALNTLNKDNIDEIKKYTNVGEEIEKVFCAVCLLFKRPENFEQARKLMADPKKFIADLQGYNAEAMPESVHKKLKKYSTDPKLTPEILEKKSAACKSICLFIRALDSFAEVMKIIKPKQKALAEAEAELKVAQEALGVKQAALQKVKDYVAGLEREYNEKLNFLESLNQKKATTELQLERADKLVGGLAGEATRWEAAEKRLGVDLVNLVGNIIIAAGYVSYVGPFTANFRKSLIDHWMKYAVEKKIPFSDDFSIEGVLGDPVMIREWNIQGLPADSLSIENGVISTSAKRWPLLIDPQSQGNKWIRNMERENNLQVVKLSNPKFLQIIESGCKIGYPVLLENIDETLDPSLGPIMERNIKKEKGSLQIKLSDGWQSFQPDFKFVVTTKMANPHYLPEICIKVTLINFTVTPEGLEDQLLVDVVKYERPELEQQRDQLVVQLSDFKKQLKELEAKILKLVGEAGDDILDDEELIVTLDQSNETSITIKQKVEEAEQTAITINESRESYRGVARRGSILYFVIADLGLIDPMYQYSLDFFGSIFRQRLDKSKKSEDLEERLEILLADLTESFYASICRGLFEAHKLLYAYLNATAIAKRAGDITAKEWHIYLRGSTTVFDQQKKADYISDEIYTKLQGLQEAHDMFGGLAASFDDDVDAVCWKEMMLSDDPVSVKMPPAYEDNLNNFQKLMIINVVRQEKLVQAMKRYVADALGEQFIVSPPFDLTGVWADSVNSSPIIFVLSPGADPIADLIALAKAKGFEARLKSLSLGQGQGPRAAKLISDGHLTGDWVCLQNCHLSASWMPELERIQEAQDENTMHPEYRLWLTSEPSKDFPVPVLQNGIKLTNEPPRGLRANLNRTFLDISEEEYESCSKAKEYKKLMFALAYFHAAILERRKYGAIGWNIQYMWMNSDLEVSKKQIKMYLEQQDLVPYPTLNYLISATNYGGRVTDDKDERLIAAMLKRYLCPEIMNDGYKLSKLDIYAAPPEGTLADTMKYIASLPGDEDPEVFGLHPNANIAYDTRTVRSIVDTIIALQPRVASGGGGKTPDQIAQDMSREMLEQLKAIGPVIDKEKAHASILEKNDKGQTKSLNVFLMQELERFNKLTSTMVKDLELLDKAISGTVVMSSDLEIMSGNFQDKKTPEKWLEPLGFPSIKPLATWLADLLERVKFIGKWWYEGAPDTYWLSCFFFPQGFMTASLQTYARKTATAIDTLKFKTCVRSYGPDDIQEVPDDGVNIHGLFLEGARWDDHRECLEDSEPRKPIVVFPVIYLEPVPMEEPIEQGCYECPLYKTTLRKGTLSTTGHSTNFVLFLYLPTELQPEYWIRRGAALLCMTDD